MRYMQIDSNDNDGDGLWNYFETYFGTDMDNADSDYDGLSDFLEIYTLNFNPNSPDTDENGILDGNEDCDGDGLSNYIYPHSSSLMAFLAACGVGYGTWMKFMGKLFGLWFVFATLLMVLAVVVGYC